MTSRRDLDKALARHPVVGAEPRQDIYRWLGVHPDRLNFKNLPMELRVRARALISNDRPKPFVIYGRPRSGSTLLVRLLDQVPAIRCDGELLHYFLLNPVRFLRDLPRRAGPEVAAYGVKLISYHLLEVHRVRRPLAFFDRISDYGYSVLHLTRNTWDQTLSLAKAQKSGLYFSKSGTDSGALTIEPGRFLELLAWNETMLAYEREVMSHVPHTPVDYDQGLADSERHQGTIDVLCRVLGVDSATVNVTIRRTGGEKGLQTVVNMEELVAQVKASPLAHLLPQGLA